MTAEPHKVRSGKVQFKRNAGRENCATFWRTMKRITEDVDRLRTKGLKKSKGYVEL